MSKEKIDYLVGEAPRREVGKHVGANSQRTTKLWTVCAADTVKHTGHVNVPFGTLTVM